ncbi:MAG TPA: hypothetical protein EYP90_02880, partial [Chromatiaceae bacterium]|nr:hypothetical protein [Chromatiaceae bacterium]
VLTVNAKQLTLANNSTPTSFQIGSTDASTVVSANFTNTLISDGNYGFVADQHSGASVTIDHTNTLFSSASIIKENINSGSPTFTSAGTVTAAPALNSLYRLTALSPAVDAGVDSGVTQDIDGDSRPAGSTHDIGADEYATGVSGSYRFSRFSYTNTEGSNVEVEAQRIGAGLGATSVQYSTSDGSATAADYSSASGTLNFGANDTTMSFTVSLTDDAIYDPQESINLVLSNPSSGTLLASPHKAVITIEDNDANSAGQIQFTAATTTINEDAGTATITVTRSGGTTGAVTVAYQTQDGTATASVDYQATSGVLNFGDGVANQTFDVTIIDDTAVEGATDETINLILTNATGGATLGTQSTAVLA